MHTVHDIHVRNRVTTTTGTHTSL